MKVYVETTIASYAMSRTSRDLVKAARQELTLEWWDHRRNDFDLYISQVVLNEAAAGNQQAAEKRLAFLHGFPILEITPAIIDLAEFLVTEGGLPENSLDDAFHLATASVHEMDFLLTWNFRHLANAERKQRMQTILLAHGYSMPIICTPEELMGESEDNDEK